MSDISKNVSSISIARHTVQFILRSAMDTQPARCFGLIGRKPSALRDLTITHATPQAVFGTTKSAARQLADCDMQHTLEDWQQQAIELCGIYFSTENGIMPEPGVLTAMENELRKKAPACSEKNLILMSLMLNTAGCLEAFTYILKDETLIPVPLLLAEDGQQTKNG